MNIFLLTETHSGCYKWRAAIPAKYLRRRGHRVQIFDMTGAARYEAPDVMVFYRAHFQEGVKIMEWCRRNGVRVVFDTDDALDLVPPENLNQRLVRPRLGLYEALIEASDVVTTTTETLAAHLRQSNPNVVVVPNSVDPEEWNSPEIAPKTGRIRIGWTGSPTHFADLAVALDAVRELQKKYDFLLVLQGICLEPTLDELYKGLLARHGRSFFETAIGRSIKIFMAKLSGIRYEFHPSVPVEEHAGKVRQLSLDVGIAPLVDNSFNRHKSCIKYYEYAMAGAVTVASHTVPYSEEVSITAKNNRDAWKQKLELVLTGDRAAMWREQRDSVLTHRNIETIVERWEQVLSGGKGSEAKVPHGRAALPEEVVQA
jgi:glycosyltransferase involved in cell wall biosynthesis